MKKMMISTLLIGAILSVLFASCKKSTDSSGPLTSGAPRTSPMPSDLQGDWSMTSSGVSYVYDGWSYGNSGKGSEVMIKPNGTGWANEIWQQATPGCILSMNLSVDHTFEVSSENGQAVLLAYVISGTYKGTGCSTVTDKILNADQTYPKAQPFKYYYKVAIADNDPSLKVLVLSQESNTSIRFKGGSDLTLKVLKKL